MMIVRSLALALLTLSVAAAPLGLQEAALSPRDVDSKNIERGLLLDTRVAGVKKVDVIKVNRALIQQRKSAGDKKVEVIKAAPRSDRETGTVKPEPRSDRQQGTVKNP